MKNYTDLGFVSLGVLITSVSIMIIFAAVSMYRESQANIENSKICIEAGGTWIGVAGSCVNAQTK